MTRACAQILLVEDSPSDRFLAREALSATGVPAELHIVPDGVEAMAFLGRCTPYEAAPRPHLILLDLNLPRKDGREVLREIKENRELRSIPVVVLTTSESEHDVRRAYDLHANCYVTKSLDHGAFTQTVRTMCEFWLSMVRLPDQSPL